MRAAYDTGPGYGTCSIASNGMWCASGPEREMCEWLIDCDVEFEMHKVLPNGRICDFYFDGRYWEMDGMDRTRAFFEEKYGDLPFVVVTPEDYEAVVVSHWARGGGIDEAHVVNGDPIVSIEPEGSEMTYDVEMAPDGPLNFIANGIVSHNSHAACYGLIAYRTAWLRANYPAEYMAALISSVMSTKDKVPFFAARCEEMGIEILPPCVNASDHEFMVVDGNIRFGLDAVKGVGHSAVEAIKRARDGKDGRFVTLWDFCERVDCQTVNKKAIEALIKCGAFDCTGASRKGMLAVLEQAQAAGQKAQQDAQIGQGSIFDLAGFGPETGGGDGSATAFAAPAHPPIPSEEFDRRELLAVEKESIGLFLSAHPLKDVREALRAKTDCALGDLPERKDGEWIRLGGMITAAKKIRTRSGTVMMFATLDDLETQIELVVFEKTLAEAESSLAVDEIVLVRGRVDHGDRKISLVVEKVEPFRPSDAEIKAAREAEANVVRLPARPLTLRLQAAKLPATVIAELKDVFGLHPGESDVVLELHTRDGIRRLRFGSSHRVTSSPSLRAELTALLGEAVVTAPASATPA